MSTKFKTAYIVGPTASGKSDLALSVAKKTGGVIVSADSMQIYRGLDVGTAKPTKKEREEVEHKLIDVVAADEEFSVAQYAELASREIDAAHKSGRLAIVVGGTGLYFEALIYPMSFAGTAKDDTVRDALQKEYEKFGAAHMHKKLAALDKKSAERLNENDVKRVIRALEVIICTGTPFSSAGDERPSYTEDDILMTALGGDRQKLYERINARVDRMFESGLVDEVFAQKSFRMQSMQAIGYKEFASCEVVDGRPVFKDGELDRIKELIKQHTRNYAKRQLTWFKRYSFAKWFDLEDPTAAEEYILSRV